LNGHLADTVVNILVCADETNQGSGDLFVEQEVLELLLQDDVLPHGLVGQAVPVVNLDVDGI